jgi:RIO kinase 1
MRTPGNLTSLVDEGIIEEVVRPLLSGKEAEVFLVRSGGELRVAKVYKEAQNRTFKNRAEYTEGRKVRNSRDQRAMDKRSRHGKAQDEAAWRSTEVDMIYRLRDAGVRVPVPYNYVDGVLVMEMVADADGGPAPRLAEVSLDRDQARAIFERLLGEVVRMLCADVVHGDLSDFNVLMSGEGPVIIDFPQSVDASKNANARKLLLRDVSNLDRFLSRFMPEQRPRAFGEEMWDLYTQSLLTPETKLTGRHRPSERKADMASVLELIGDANFDEHKRREREGLTMKGVPTVTQPVGGGYGEARGRGPRPPMGNGAGGGPRPPQQPYVGRASGPRPAGNGGGPRTSPQQPYVGRATGQRPGQAASAGTYRPLPPPPPKPGRGEAAPPAPQPQPVDNGGGQRPMAAPVPQPQHPQQARVESGHRAPHVDHGGGHRPQPQHQQARVESGHRPVQAEHGGGHRPQPQHQQGRVESGHRAPQHVENGGGHRPPQQARGELGHRPVHGENGGGHRPPQRAEAGGGHRPVHLENGGGHRPPQARGEGGHRAPPAHVEAAPRPQPAAEHRPEAMDPPAPLPRRKVIVSVSTTQRRPGPRRNP